MINENTTTISLCCEKMTEKHEICQSALRRWFRISDLKWSL